MAAKNDELRMEATGIFEWIAQAKKRFVVLQGAGQCSKTTSLIQHFIAYIISHPGNGRTDILSICRKTFNSLRGSAMRDFLNILDEYKLYSEENHDRTNHEYRLNGWIVEFLGADQPQKLRGRKRKLCWLNEANEFEFEDFHQLNIRTSGQLFFDYNPSDEYHWIYDKVINQKDRCNFKIFTWQDNPFMPEEIKAEILALENQDENLWRIYGLGERGKAEGLIYSNWDSVDEFPHVCEHYRYGLDFGFNHPSALVFVGVREKDLYIKEIIYQTHLTNGDLIDLMKAKGVAKNVMMKADSAEPDRIKELDIAGFSVSPAKKGKGSIKDRIDSMKRKRLHITKDSLNVIKEIKNYRWKKHEKTGDYLDEPVKYKDDAMDALGYSVGDIIINDHLFNESIHKFDRHSLPRRSIDRYSLSGGRR